MPDENDLEIQLPAVWVGVDDAPIVFVNQFAAQVNAGEVTLTFGQASAPMLLGTVEEQKAQAAQLPFVPVRSVARLGLTPARLRELVGILQQTLNRADKQAADASQPPRRPAPKKPRR